MHCLFPENTRAATDLELNFFMTKHILIVMTGFLSATYILSKKTFVTWKKFFERISKSRSSNNIQVEIEDRFDPNYFHFVAGGNL